MSLIRRAYEEIENYENERKIEVVELSESFGGVGESNDYLNNNNNAVQKQHNAVHFH